jgi:hypothetical protein
MPIDIISATILTCDRLLREADGVFSAIRIVDLVYVSPGASDDATVEFFALIIVKAMPDDNEHTVTVVHRRHDGTDNTINEHKRRIKPHEHLANVPTGFNVQVQLNITVRSLGTHYLRLLIDGQETAKAAFSIARQPFPLPTAE